MGQSVLLKMVLGSLLMVMFAACGSSNNDDSQTLKAPPAAEIETPPMPDNS